MERYTYYHGKDSKKNLPTIIGRYFFRGKSGAFFWGFLVILVALQVGPGEQITQMGQWLEQSVQQLDAKALDQQQLLFYLLICRGLLFVLLILFGLTRIRRLLFYLICMAAGAVSGAMLLGAVSALGTKGLLLFFGILFPHGVCYMILFLFLFWVLCEERWEDADLGKKQPKQVMQGIFYGMVSLFLLGSGIYLECTMNPLLLGWIKGVL